MNPIQLSSPDGHVYAYACGVCHNVCAGSYAMGPWPASGPHENLATYSLRDAERCCKCTGCGTGPVADHACIDCDRDHRARRMWSSIATCMREGFATQEQFDKYQQDEFDAFLRDDD